MQQNSAGHGQWHTDPVSFPVHLVFRPYNDFLAVLSYFGFLAFTLDIAFKFFLMVFDRNSQVDDLPTIRKKYIRSVSVMHACV